jgi:hypothetical protein
VKFLNTILYINFFAGASKCSFKKTRVRMSQESASHLHASLSPLFHHKIIRSTALMSASRSNFRQENTTVVFHRCLSSSPCGSSQARGVRTPVLCRSWLTRNFNESVGTFSAFSALEGHSLKAPLLLHAKP